MLEVDIQVEPVTHVPVETGSVERDAYLALLVAPTVRGRSDDYAYHLGPGRLGANDKDWEFLRGRVWRSAPLQRFSQRGGVRLNFHTERF